ncbi:protein LBH-like [Osmerus eperlanus]|uniref:protein LBH-like n=1 Tax=Osmerus eperlanus TaxID=29151 RepID=UPI002E13093E
MSCTPASGGPASPHSVITITGPTDSPMEESPGQRRGSRAYQIFPEFPVATESNSKCELHCRERLPSIVVEPTEMSEVDSGELRWPLDGPEEDEDPFNENSLPRTDSPSGGEQSEDMGAEDRSAVRRQSIGPAQGQLNLSRLTPPPSPPSPEAAPPSPEAAPPSQRSTDSSSPTQKL